jgi:hypothetical protein
MVNKEQDDKNIATTNRHFSSSIANVIVEMMEPNTSGQGHGRVVLVTSP